MVGVSLNYFFEEFELEFEAQLHMKYRHLLWWAWLIDCVILKTSPVYESHFCSSLSSWLFCCLSFHVVESIELMIISPSFEFLEAFSFPGKLAMLEREL